MYGWQTRRVGNKRDFQAHKTAINPTVRAIELPLPRWTSRLSDPRSFVSSSVRHPLWFVVAPPHWLGASLCAKAQPVHQSTYSNQHQQYSQLQEFLEFSKSQEISGFQKSHEANKEDEANLKK
jgi:hypothetical protein